MNNSKLERNNEIKRLFKEGMFQIEIGKKYGISQTRISVIVGNKKPGTRINYCYRCGVRASIGFTCNDCRAKSAALRIERGIESARKRSIPKTCAKCTESTASPYGKLCNAHLVESWTDKKTNTICIWCDSETFDSQKMCDPCAPYAKKVRVLGLSGRDLVRGMVRARDNYTCQDCGLVRTYEEVKEYNKSLDNLKGKMKSLDIHHLEGECGKNSRGYDSFESMPQLITLCHKCHFNHHEHSRMKNPNQSMKPLSGHRGLN